MPRKDSESSVDSHGSCDSHDHEEDTSLKNDAVVSKYLAAAEIANDVIKAVIAEVKEGAVVGDICTFGDKLINEKTSHLFKKNKNASVKGIAMPTCISVDSVICHYSPLKSEAPITLKNGQVVKIDLGVHLDGFIASVAHTVVVGASKTNVVTGKIGDLIKATYEGMEVAIRSLRPEKTNIEISNNIDKVAAEYGVTPIENMVSHQIDKNEIDGEKQIVQNPGEKQLSEVTKIKIEPFEAYIIDVIYSTGKGKPKDLDTRTTVYKKNEAVQYQLKMKASRTFIAESNKTCGYMPFSLRNFEDETKAKLGVVECEKHGLLTPYPVLYEAQGEFVAQFKATVLVMANGLLKITGLPFDSEVYQSEKSIKNADLSQVLTSALKPKKKKKAAAAPAAATKA